MNKPIHIKERADERGSALIYILIAIALLAALTITFMGSSNQQTQSQNTFKLVSELQTQVEFIRTSVQECVLSHPGGDIHIDNTPTGTDPGADRRYPIKPSSTYFSGATVGPTIKSLVKDLRCPGNPGDNINHVALFGGTSGKYMSPPPALFDDWQWYNGDDGIFFWISTAKTDAFIQSAMDKLNDGYAPCEADKIDASASASDVPLDSDNTVSCPAHSYCFRIWLKTIAGSATYPNEPSCP